MSTPEAIKYKKRLVALASNGLWYEDDTASPADMALLSLSDTNIDVSKKISMFEAFQKMFIVNGSNLKVADFGNIKLTTADVAANPPDKGNILTGTGGTDGPTMIVDYITALSSTCVIYGFKIDIETGSNTKYENNGDGKTKVTCTAHGLINGNFIRITGTTSYNDDYAVEQKTANTYVIPETFAADDATGDWEMIFGSGETVTGTDDDSNAISFATSAAEVAPPHWYDWTVYGGDTSFGTMPAKAVLGCLYRGRALIAGNEDAPHMWYMSRQANPWDWLYYALDAQSAVAGNDADAGEIGDIITAVIAHKDDYAIFGATNSTWIMRGDPAIGGSIDRISSVEGIFGERSWCWDDKFNLYWMSRNGICVMDEKASGVQNITVKVLPNMIADLGLDPELHMVTLQYDQLRVGINIFVTTLTSGANSNYWLDLRTNAFMQEDYPDGCGVYSSTFYNTEDDDYRRVVVGCKDGFVRYFDDTLKKDINADSSYTAIDSKVLLGPFLIAEDDRNVAVLKNLLITTAGGASGGSQSDTDQLEWEIYIGDTAEEVVEGASAGTSPLHSGTITSPGITRLYNRSRGTYIGILLKNNTVDTTWSVEKILGRVKELTAKVD